MRGRIPTRGIVVVMAVAIFSAALPASAGSEDGGLEPLHEGGRDGPGWVMYRFDPAGEHVSIHLEVPRLAGAPVVEVAAMFYDENLELRFGYVFTGLIRDDGVYVDSTLIGEEDPLVDTYGDWSGSGRLAINSEMNAPDSPNDPLSGMCYVALWAAGSVGEHTHAFYGANGVELLEVEQDVTAYYYTTEDFGGSLATRVSSGPVGARTIVDGSVEHTIEGNLLGLFTSGVMIPAADELTIEKPDGSIDECRCLWTDLTAPDASGPGDYRLTATGASATSNGGDQVRSSVIDVTVPNKKL